MGTTDQGHSRNNDALGDEEVSQAIRIEEEEWELNEGKEEEAAHVEAGEAG